MANTLKKLIDIMDDAGMHINQLHFLPSLINNEALQAVFDKGEADGYLYKKTGVNIGTEYSWSRIYVYDTYQQIANLLYDKNLNFAAEIYIEERNNITLNKDGDKMESWTSGRDHDFLWIFASDWTDLENQIKENLKKYEEAMIKKIKEDQ